METKGGLWCGKMKESLVRIENFLAGRKRLKVKICGKCSLLIDLGNDT